MLKERTRKVLSFLISYFCLNLSSLYLCIVFSAYSDILSKTAHLSSLFLSGVNMYHYVLHTGKLIFYTSVYILSYLMSLYK